MLVNMYKCTTILQTLYIYDVKPKYTYKLKSNNDEINIKIIIKLM